MKILVLERGEIRRAIDFNNVNLLSSYDSTNEVFFGNLLSDSAWGYNVSLFKSWKQPIYNFKDENL